MMISPFSRLNIFGSNSGGSVWILATGLWNDSGVWIDSDVWID